MEISLKKIQKEDLNLLASFMQQSFKESPWYEQWSYESCQKRLSILFSMETFVGYELVLKNKVIGASFGFTLPYEKETQFHLIEFFLAPKFTKQGYGTEFMKLLLEECRKNKMDRIVLSTKGNLSSFYSKFGFGFQSDYIMEKKI